MQRQSYNPSDITVCYTPMRLEGHSVSSWTSNSCDFSAWTRCQFNSKNQNWYEYWIHTQALTQSFTELSHTQVLQLMLSPLGFHCRTVRGISNSLLNWIGKPKKLFYVWGCSTFIMKWIVLTEYYEQFAMQEVPILMKCTTRTFWICLKQDLMPKKSLW